MDKQVFNFVVENEFDGWRIDKWLAKMVPTVSRVRLQKMLKSGFVLDSNDEVVADVRLKISEGDSFTITIVPEEKSFIMKPQDIPLDILYEDDDLIVINKPAGMVCHQGAGREDGTLVNALLYHTNGVLSSFGAEAGRAGIVHRLDKDTSGAMMACKSDRAHIEMYKQFANHDVKREYYALVWGIVNPVAGVIDKNIGRNPHNRQEMQVMVDGGKKAITNYETLEVFTGSKFKPVSLIKCQLETGRTHQIRVHLASMGNPIIGDAVYGNIPKQLVQIENKEVKTMLASVKRQMLHSKNIEFVHPITKELLKFETKIPDDMQAILDFFRYEV